jgi:hypothetical protein
MSLSTNSTIPASLLPSSSLSLVQNSRINYKWQWYGGRTVRGLSIVLVARTRTQVASEVHSVNAHVDVETGKYWVCHIPGKSFHLLHMCTLGVPPYSSFIWLLLYCSTHAEAVRKWSVFAFDNFFGCET